MSRSFTCAAWFAMALLSVGAASAQVAVYDNTTTDLSNHQPLLPWWLNDSGVEMGDDIWLAGTARQATELRLIFDYNGTVPGTFDAELRFRSVDEATQMPSAVFYDSGIIQALPTVGGINVYTFAIPDVTVPDHFVWTVQAYNRQGSVGEIGPEYFNPATVGFSDDFFWLSNGADTWTQYSWGGDPYANFGARLTAVPEPMSTLGLLLGAIGLAARKRRRTV